MEDELGVFPILKLKTNISIVKTEKNKQTNKQTKQRRWRSRSHPHSCFSLSFTDKSESFVNDSPSASMTFKPEVKVEKIKLPVVEFPEEEPWLKWLLRISTIALLVTLIGLWIRFA